ncbi:hypothetical protein D3C72_1178090 [compost metagenome]
MGKCRSDHRQARPHVGHVACERPAKVMDVKVLDACTVQGAVPTMLRLAEVTALAVRAPRKDSFALGVLDATALDDLQDVGMQRDDMRLPVLRFGDGPSAALKIDVIKAHAENVPSTLCR